MDAFSEILGAVKLKGALFFRAEFSAPWGITSPPSTALAKVLAPGTPLVVYHFVVGGVATAKLGPHSLALEGGDVVVCPHGDGHFLGNGAASREIDGRALLKKISSRDLSPMRAGGGGDITRFVCGYMASDPLLGRSLLDGLPPIFKVNIRADRAGQWLETSILHLAEEAASGRAGSEAMLAKLSEALFVETLRRYVTGLPEQHTGWIAGARDPIVGRSLALLHARVRHPWTIAELAREAGVSRSALAERFRRYLSQPPMAYLTRWRLQLAARALAATSRGVAQIAADIGYESEAAFHRAFKRAYALPPAQYRRKRRANV